MHSITHLEYFIWSPNLVWFTMALAIHVFFPYPIEEAKSQGFALSWMLSRFCLNYTVALAYYGFFYVGLYWRKWATRKYRPGVDPNSLHCTVNPNPIDQVLTPTSLQCTVNPNPMDQALTPTSLQCTVNPNPMDQALTRPLGICSTTSGTGPSRSCSGRGGSALWFVYGLQVP